MLDDRDQVNFLMTSAMQASMLASGLVAIAVAVVLVRRGERRASLLWVLAIGGVVLLDPVLKPIFHRDAIGGGGEWSFPSGNAMVSMALVAAAVVLLADTAWRRRAVAIGAALVVLEGLWLVAIQWHYPSDVAAGWLIAVAWVSALTLSGVVARGPRLGARRPSFAARAR